MQEKNWEDYYEILGVDSDASDETIHKAYLRAVNYWHPDRNKAHNATEMAASVNVGYGVLSDPNERQKFHEE